MYHHSEGYPNAPQHSNTEGSPAPPSLCLQQQPQLHDLGISLLAALRSLA